MRNLNELNSNYLLIVREIEDNCRYYVEKISKKNGRSDAYIRALKNSCLFCLEFSIREFNLRTTDDVLNFFYSSEDNLQVFLEKYKEYYGRNRVEINHSGLIKSISPYRIAFNFITDEIFALYGTNLWLSLGDNVYNKNYNATERVLFCLDCIFEFNKPTVYELKSNKKKFQIVASLINDYCGHQFITFSMITKYFEGQFFPNFVEYCDGVNYSERSSKPYVVLEAIEALAHAPQGYLTSIIPKTNVLNTHKLSDSGSVVDGSSNFKYVERLNVSLLPDQLRLELYNYCFYKTEPLLDKKINEQWKVRKCKGDLPKETVLDAKLISNFYVYTKDLYVPSYSSFVGVTIALLKKVLELGLLTYGELTLFNVYQPDILRAVLANDIKKDGYVLMSFSMVMQYAKTIWHPDHCFFCEFSREIICDYYNVSSDDVIEMSKKNYDSLFTIYEKIKPFIKTSPRSHNARNEKIIELDSPASYVFDALKKAYLDLDIYLNSNNHQIKVKYYCVVRDIILVECLLICPLRVRNWADMKIGFHKEDECIYKDKDGIYKISIPKSQFKNYKQRNIPERFQLSIPENLTHILDLYVDTIRPLFMSETEPHEYFFVSSLGRKQTGTAISTCTRKFTALYADQSIKSGGIGAHYFRHIVATTYLKIHRGAFGYVALILLDSEEVIRRHYGHLDHEDAIGDWKKNLSNIRNAALG